MEAKGFCKTRRKKPINNHHPSSGLIGVYDSGVGGLSIWREIARQLPGEDTIYVADQAHLPYGSRSLNQVRNLAEGVTRFLLDQGAKIVVIACNTASAGALRYLRDLFPAVPFVGMEPAIKPAVERTRTGIVGVIATQTTFQGELFASLMVDYGNNVQVLSRVGRGLVQAVEAGALDTPETEILVRQCLTPLLEAGVDQLALGCTHYPFLRPVIERVAGPEITIIDPAPAVARQTGRLLAQWGLENGQARPGRHRFYTSGDRTAFAAKIERLVPSLQNAEVRAVRWQAGHPRQSCSASKCLPYSTGGLTA